MALPKLNATPSYEMTIPSTGHKVTFRPFLVKEQRNLLIALETQDRKDLVRAIIRTIEACVEQPIKQRLTTFDVDYMFTVIRSKSVGEKAEIVMKCGNCDNDNEVSVALDDVEMSSQIQSTTIELTPQVTIEMKYPTYEEFLHNESLDKVDNAADALIELVISCMDSVLTEEEQFNVSDEPKEEIVQFIESMSNEQFEKLTKFVNSVPAVQKKVQFECTSCGHANERTLRGMDDFFS